MKKIFLDTNVILDAVIPERKTHEAANAVLSANDEGTISGSVSVLTVANAAYILKKGRTTKETTELLKEMFEGLEILPMDKSQISEALALDAPDFEDALQYACAKAAGRALIVTANTKHFRFCTDMEVADTADYASQFAEDE